MQRRFVFAGLYSYTNTNINTNNDNNKLYFI